MIKIAKKEKFNERPKIRIPVNLQEMEFVRKSIIICKERKLQGKEFAGGKGEWNLKRMDFARNGYAYSLYRRSMLCLSQFVGGSI